MTIFTSLHFKSAKHFLAQHFQGVIEQVGPSVPIHPGYYRTLFSVESFQQATAAAREIMMRTLVDFGVQPTVKASAVTPQPEAVEAPEEPAEAAPTAARREVRKVAPAKSEPVVVAPVAAVRREDPLRRAVEAAIGRVVAEIRSGTEQVRTHVAEVREKASRRRAAQRRNAAVLLLAA